MQHLAWSTRKLVIGGAGEGGEYRGRDNKALQARVHISGDSERLDTPSSPLQSSLQSRPQGAGLYRALETCDEIFHPREPSLLSWA